MMDLHTHILPGVDDGVSDIEESIGIIEEGIENGISTFILTPHIRGEADWKKMDHIKEAFNSLKKECEERKIDVVLILGAEILLTPELPDKLKDNTDVVIRNCKNNYLLIELPFYQLPIYTEDVLYELLLKRYIPIMAHPERYVYLETRLQYIKKWVKNGVKLQMNSGSLQGKYGARVNSFARRLLKKGLIHYIGSDTHSPNNLKTFGESVKIATDLTGKNYTSFQSLDP